MRLKNLVFVNILVLLLCCFGGSTAFGQEVEILHEDFEGYTQNSVKSKLWHGKVWWTGSDPANCSAKVINSNWNSEGKSVFLRNVYNSDYFNKYAVWKTIDIDISDYKNINFSIDAAYIYGKIHYENGNNNNEKEISDSIGEMIIEYKIDNGVWSELVIITNNKNAITKTKKNINGLSIRIRARSKCIRGFQARDSNSEYYEVKYVIDNFILKGTKKTSVTAEKVLWLKADAGVSPSSNNRISSWNDQTVNNNNASSYYGINEYNDNSLNYNPGIRFDESNTRFMTISDSPSLRLNEFSVFSVIKPINLTAFDAIVSKHSSSYESGFGLQYLHDASHLKLLLNTAENDNAYNYYPNNSATVAISNTAHIAGGIYDKSNIRVFTDIDESRYSYSYDVVNNGFDLVIGADHTSVDAIDVFDGDINEIIIYNYAVSEDEKNKIESYLAIKYGITLNHDYVSSSDDLMYTYDDYKYDIAGLANDDTWGLNQKISSSSNKTSSDASNLIISTSNSFNTTNKDTSNSLEDGESIVWGKNDANKSAWIAEGNYKHVGERWKINKNSDIDLLYFQLNLSAYPTPDSGSQYFLLIDDDETTVNGITKKVELTKNADLYNAFVGLSRGVSYMSVGYENYVPMKISISGLTKPTSYGVSDGQISFKVNGGNSPYVYSITNITNGSEVDSGSSIDGINMISSSLVGGNYKIVIEDNSGNEIEKNVFLYQAPQITSSDSGDISECSSSNLSTNEISVTDPKDYCIDFSNTTGSLHLDDSSEINIGGDHDKRTIMFWFKTSDTSSLQFLYKEGGAINGISFYIKDGYLYANMWSNRKSFGDMKTNLINQNSWHHAALTWDKDEVVNDKGFKAYIDGNLINSLKGLNLPSHSGDIWIGNQEKSLMQGNILSTGNAIYKGQIDDFKLWNEPLTEQQVRDEMAKSTKSTIDNLVVQYDFNDPTGSVKDISGNSYGFTENISSVPYKSLYSVEWENGSSGFSRTVNTSGEAEFSYVLKNEKGGAATGNIKVLITDANKFMTAEAIVHNPCKGESNGMIELRAPCAMHFDGNPTKQRIDCGSKFMDNLNQFTMEGWLRFDLDDMRTGRYSFFGQDDTIEFGIYNSSPNQFHIWSSRGEGAYFPLSIYPNDLNWHHFAIVGSGTQYIFYVDGKIVGTPFTHTDIGSGAYGQGHSNSNNVFIGGSVFDGVSSDSNTFKGDMYKVGFWNRALSALELENIFKNNTDYTGDETGLIAGYNFYEGQGNILKAAGEDNTHTATISSASNLPQWDAFKYLWSNGEKTKKIEGLPAGDYTVNVELSAGCTLSRQYTITEPETAVSVSLDVQADVCDGKLIDISAIVANGTTDMRYFFFEGDKALPKSKDNSYEKSFTYNLSNVIIPLKVKVVDKNGCSAESLVKELHVYPKIKTQPIKRK